MVRFRALLELKDAASGGRREPIFSGYRSLLPHGDGYVSVAFDLVGVSELQPGGSADADVRIPTLTLHDWDPQVGDRFEVFESPGRAVAEGVVMVLDRKAAAAPPELVKAD